MNQEYGKTGGFFSKMLQKFKGAPADGASELAEAGDGDGVYTQQILSQIMDRKRQNDAIRMQEFAQLRHLRSNGRSGSLAAAHAASAFAPSALDTGARAATTLQKIDAIEAQMAHQWWRPQGNAPMAAGGAPTDAVTLPQAESAAGVERHGLQALTPAQWLAIPTLGHESMVQPMADADVAIAALPLQSLPDLEEAAILFAHGDLDSAKARLLEQLVQALDAQPLDNAVVAPVWHAVLDLYRATGDSDGFEPLAIDYAAHFERSAPLWFSMPEQLGIAPLHGAEAPVAQAKAFTWKAPAVLKPEALGILEAAQQKAPGPWTLDWSALTQIDAAAVLPMAQLLERWAQQPGQWIWTDAGRLRALLARQTPVGVRGQAPAWWALRLAALRMGNEAPVFDQVALDYCVTYEVSPPSWVAPACQCDMLEDPAAFTAWEESAQSGFAPNGRDTAVGAGRLPQPGEGEGLAGVIEGDAMPWLRPLQAHARLGVPLEIPCDLLVRMDFLAAGSVLNWSAEMQAQGHMLRFTQLHHLMAVLFQVIGIQEHARLVVRKV